MTRPPGSPSCGERRDAGELAVTEIVPGARTILLDGLTDPAATTEAVRHWSLTPDEEPAAEPETVEVAVSFDGADLAFVAGRWGTDEAGVVRRLVETPLHVAFCGFSPGFAYLAGLPPELAVPRLETPAAPGSGRIGGAGRHVRGHLSHRVARRLAPGRPYRRRALRSRPRPAGAADPVHPRAPRGPGLEVAR